MLSVKFTLKTQFSFFFLTIETNQKEIMRCYTCYVTTSWKDCKKNGTVELCPKGDDEVCVTMRVDKWDVNNKPMTEYTKHCSAASYCSDDECEDLGWKCTIQCCNEPLCNTSITILANIILVIVISCLQTVLY